MILTGYLMLKVFYHLMKNKNITNNFDLPIIGILGFIYKDKYYDFTIQKYTNNEEKEIFKFLPPNSKKLLMIIYYPFIIGVTQKITI